MKCFCVVQHFPSNWGVVVVQDVLGIARGIFDLVSATALPRNQGGSDETARNFTFGLTSGHANTGPKIKSPFLGFYVQRQ